MLLCHPHRITGRITDPSGAPIAGGTVWLSGDVAPHAEENPRLPSQLEEVHKDQRPFAADESGHYDTGHSLIVHKWTAMSAVKVRAMAKGYSVTEQAIPRDEFRDFEARLDFTLEPELPIVLLVADPAGKPVEGAEVATGSEEGLG